MRRAGQTIAQTFTTLPQAERFRDLVEVDGALRRHGLPGITQERRRLVDLVEAFREEADARALEGSLRASTAEAYRKQTAGPLKWLLESGRETVNAAELDDRAVAAYVAWRRGRRLSDDARRPAGSVQVRKDLVMLRRVYGWAAVEPAWRIPRHLPRSTGGKRVVPRTQLFAWLDAMPRGSLQRTVAELAIATGMRPGDIYALEFDQVDLANKLITFAAAKTGRAQVVPIGDELHAHLEAWLRERMPAITRRLFHLRGLPLTDQTLRSRFRTASKAAAIEPPLQYLGVARNAVIAWLLEAGQDPYAVARLVGHSQLATTMGYQRAYLPLDALRRATGALSDMRRGDT